MNIPFLKKKDQAPEKIFEAEVTTSKDIIAPASVKIQTGYLEMGGRLAKSFFVFSYPRYLSAAWLSSAINLDVPMDISIHVHPVDTGFVLKQLRRKVTEIQSELIEKEDKGLVRDPELETGFQDLESLRDRLQTAQEKMFKFGLYITIYGETEEELRKIETTLRSIFESRLIYIKPALYQQKEGFNSCLPYGKDLTGVHTSMNTEPLSSTFPFVSFDLSSNEGVLYGINRHNNSLILFDRFSLENANEVLFAKSGSGKSIRGSEPVLIRTKEGIQLQEIGPLVDKIIKERGVIKIDEELEGVINPGLEVYSFNKNLKGEWSKVTVAARKDAPSTLYRFTTKSGREITTTGDHNMLVLRNGVVEIAKSTDVKRGEYIPLPRAVENTKNPRLEFVNLLRLLKNSEKTYILGGEKILRDHKKKLQNTVLDQRLDRYRYHYETGRAMPLSYLSKILEHLNVPLDDTSLQSLKIVSRIGKKRYQLPAQFPLNSAFLRVLGYVTAEGTTQQDVVMISNTDEEVLKDIGGALSSLGIPFFYGNRGVVIASPIFSAIVRELGCSGKSGTKRVPPLLFGLDNQHKAAYLTGYFEGDGGVESGNAVTACSKSKSLISDINYLLLHFGIVGRMAKTKKKPTCSDWGRKRTYYKLTISGQENLRRFAAAIDFVSKEKQGKILKTLRGVANTNVDIIPGLAPLFQEIDDLFGFQLHGVSNLSPLKRNVFAPSPNLLLKTVREIEQKIREFKNLAPTYKLLGGLPQLSRVLENGAEDKELNRKLWSELGQSWRTAKTKRLPPFSKNAFKMIKIVEGISYSLHDVKQRIYSGFQEMDLEVKSYNPSLQSALVERPESNTSYEMLQKAAHHVWENYSSILEYNIPRTQEILDQLRTLARSDLFWDPIQTIQQITGHKEKYVYDLTVDNEMFLAGTAGMFVHNSYAVKLEVLRQLMTGTDVIILDPENEYKTLSEAVGGSFFDISLGSENHINPFDLATPREDEKPEDVLRSNIINLVGLMRIMLGGLSPEEDAVMDRAISETYAAKDIRVDSDPATWAANIPLMEDLEQVLGTMEGAESLVRRLRKYTKGTYSNFFNQQTNIALDNKLIAFGIRDMEEGLRPMAMYIIMRYIWNEVRSELKKRILVIDEAWWIMQSEDGASFLYGIAKRARKYYLGVTTITQDVGDFMKSQYGRPIITNSSIQILMKQSPATIDLVKKSFNLTSQEKNLLLETEVGEGIFFAGQKHVAIKVVASPAEHEIITTSPEELLRKKTVEEYKETT